MDTKKTPLAVAIFAEIASIACLLAVVLFPTASRAVFESWFHGYNIDQLWEPSFTILSVVIRLVSVFIFTYLATWVFVIVYKGIVKK